MKTSCLCLFLAATFLLTLRADPTTSTAAAPSPTQEQRLEKFQAAMEKLDLTDDQKAKIKQIRASVTDPKERREQVMAVLTPEQKEKLKQMIMERRKAQ